MGGQGGFRARHCRDPRGRRNVVATDTFRASETIRVLERSRADVSLLDQSVLRLNANTTLTLKSVKDERTSMIDLLRGAAHFFSRGPRSLEVQTPFVTAGIRGTEFFVRVEADQVVISK
jgi:ferric-dicitrate binding protein FerR (iron transport regulator)